MTSIYEGTSFDLTVTFYDDDASLVTPESLTYTIETSGGSVIRTATVTPDSSSYTIPVTITDNTITGDEEKRKIIISWTYNNGAKGDVKVYRYKVEAP